MILPVLGAKSWDEWEDGKPIKHLGTNYSALKIKAKGPVIVSVKVPGEPVITDKAIRDGFKAQSVAWVEFSEFEEDISMYKGVTYYKATATTATLVVGDIYDHS